MMQSNRDAHNLYGCLAHNTLITASATQAAGAAMRLLLLPLLVVSGATAANESPIKHVVVLFSGACRALHPPPYSIRRFDPHHAYRIACTPPPPHPASGLVGSF